MDSTWVEHLIDEYSSGLLRYIKQHVHTTEDAEDILQDVFLSVYEHAAEFDPERCNEQAWLYIIAKRKIVSYYRQYKTDDSIDAMEDYEIPGVDSMAQATHLMGCRQAVGKALSTLDERARKIVVMKYFEDLTGDEIAKRMGLTPSNVRVILSRAMDKMNAQLEDFDFEDIQ